MTEALRVLMLEENPADAESAGQALAKGGRAFESRRVDSEAGFRAALAEFQPELILADFRLAGFSGNQALMIAHAHDPDLPFIFVTGAIGEEKVVELMRLGADDYVLKDRLFRLPIAVDRALARRQERQAHAESSANSALLTKFLLDSSLPFAQGFLDGRIGIHNQAARELGGYTESELARLNWLTDLTPPEWQELERHKLEELLRTGQPVVYEKEFIRKDGSRVPTEMRLHLIRKRTGGPDYFYAFMNDISQRRHDMATLAHQTRRAEALLELPRAGDRMGEAEFMQYGLDLAEKLTGSQIAFSHFISDDQETIELVAWSRRTLEQYCTAAYDRHYPVSEAGIWADALRQGRPVVFNDYASAPFRHGLPDGHAALVRLISVPVIEGGLVRMLAGVGNRASPYDDIDVETVQLIANEIWRIVQHRRTQNKLARFSQVIENSANEVYLFDSRTLLFLDANRGALANIGYSLDELRSLTPVDLKPEFDRAAFDHLIEPLLTGKQASLRFSTTHRRKDGSLYPVDVSIELTGDTPPIVLATILDITERKAFEARLEKSRELLELALEGSNLGTWDWRIDLGTAEVNERWAEMLGYRLSELQPLSIETWFGLCHKEDVKAAREALDRHFRKETPFFDCENRLRHKDGHWVWVLDRGKVVEWDADGKPIRMAGTHLDITERKNAELALLESAGRFRALFENNLDGVLLTSPDGSILAANWEAQRLFGKTEAELIEAGRRGVVDPTDPRLPAALAERGRTGCFRGELTMIGKHGQPFPAELSSLVFRDQQGQVMTSMIVRDITERKAADEKLRKLSLAVEQSPASIVITDLNARIEYANPAFTKVSGYLGEEVLGKTPNILHSGKTPRGTYDQLWATLGRGEVWRGEFINRRKDGSEFTEMAVISPVRQADGRITHYLAIKQDITEQKHIEEELAQHRQHLEELVELRTVELVAAQRDAERLARVKSEFLANMSHEIRTPLNAVLGFAQIGQRDSQGRKAQQTFSRILDSGQLLLGIVNDILDFSKMEAGKLVIEAGTVDLRELIDRCADQVRDHAEAKNLEFRIATTADLPATCRGDSLRLTQVLSNLLSNAVKFTERGSVTLAAAREGDELVFRVGDTGIGMGEDQVARLFTAFEQADSSTTRKFGGTGLGLAITRRLLDLMGGHVRVHSQRGQGSTFEARLPLQDPAGRLADQPPRAIRAAREETDRGRLRGLSILVAEDNEVNRLVLEDMLTGEGCRLEQVENGLLAVERVGRMSGQPYDLVLMDVQMPVMDGYKATRRLREIAPDLPVIGLTAHALAEEKEKCLAAGMVEHLAKPVELDALLAAIRRHVKGALPETAKAAAGTAIRAAAPGTETDWAGLEQEYASRPGFLLKLLTTVRETHAGQPVELCHLCEARDYQRLAIVAHGLKGLSGNVLPRSLREQAALTETTARHGQAEALGHARQLAAGLDGWLDEIDRYLDSHTQAGIEAGAETPMPWPDIAAALDRLETLLGTDDTGAGPEFWQQQASLRHALGEEVDTLGRQIDLFDFTAAQATLRHLRERMPPCADPLNDDDPAADNGPRFVGN